MSKKMLATRYSFLHSFNMKQHTFSLTTAYNLWGIDNLTIVLEHKLHLDQVLAPLLLPQTTYFFFFFHNYKATTKLEGTTGTEKQT